MTRLLIVDDEPDIREIIRRYAELEGYETEEASDGFEALSLCREKDFDVAVMDIMMPGMDGYTACREIRKVKDRILPTNCDLKMRVMTFRPSPAYNTIFPKTKKKPADLEKTSSVRMVMDGCSVTWMPYRRQSVPFRMK